MKTTFIRKTGFYGMGSSIQLRINNEKRSVLSHEQKITLDLEVPFTMQVTFYWLKSPVYTVKEAKPAYVITMNYLILQIYPFLFLATGLGAVFLQNLFFSFFAVIVLIAFFFYIKNRAYLIKEENYANSDLFLISFNRIEKWMRDEMGNARNMGFTELVRRLAQRKQLMIRKYEDDLLQLAQLRNAIVHDRIAVDFVIAEPNDWTVKRIQLIEQELIQPETVLPRFAKRVTGFEQDLPLLELLKIVAEKRYSQFPLYNKGKFVALITLRNIGFWLAKESQKGPVDLTNKRALDLIIQNGKYTNYHFVPAKTHIYEVEAMFREQGTLEAVLITKDGNPDGNLLGIVRPRDIYKQIEKD